MEDKKSRIFCSNHPDVEAVEKCQDCGKFFCRDCVMKIDGRYRCHQCHKLLENIADLAGYSEKYNLKKLRFALGGCFVLFFLALLAAIGLILIPYLRLGSAIRCNRQLKQVYQVMLVYSSDDDAAFPPDNNDLMPLYKPKYSEGVDLMKALRCPGTKNEVKLPVHLKDDSPATIGMGMSYFYQGGLKATEDEDEKTPLLWDQHPDNHKGEGINVLHTNGSIKFIDKSFPVLDKKTEEEEAE